MSRDSQQKPQAQRVGVPVQRRSATPGATNAAHRRYAGVRRDPDAPQLDPAAMYAAGEAHRAVVQRKAALAAASPDPYDPFDMITADRDPVQRKAVADAMDAPKEDSIREDRATIDPDVDPGVAATSDADGGQASSRGDSVVADMDAPKEDSIQEDRATIEDDSGKAAASSSPLSPAKASRAARKNRHWAQRLGLSPAAFGSSAGVGTPAFAQAVAEFQAAHGLTVDGVAGPQTAAALRGGDSGRDAVASRGDAHKHRSLLQMKSTGEPNGDADVQGIAAAGVQGSGQTLPHLDRIQTAFGQHDVTGIRAHVSGTSAKAASAIDAEAYATGNDVAFRSPPDLHTAAHEAAHVVQQRAGVQLKSGVGEVGDTYEQHADAVADLVVQGRSAEGLLGVGTAHSGPVTAQTQRKESGSGIIPAPKKIDFIRDAKDQLLGVLEAMVSGISEAEHDLLEPRVEERDPSVLLNLLSLAANAVLSAVASIAGEVVAGLVARGAGHAGSVGKPISAAASSIVKQAITTGIHDAIHVELSPSLRSTFSSVQDAKIANARGHLKQFANLRLWPLLRSLPEPVVKSVDDALLGMATNPDIIAAQKRAAMVEWANFCARATYGASDQNHTDINRFGAIGAGLLDTHNPGYEMGNPNGILKLEVIRRGAHGLATADWELRSLSLGGGAAVREQIRKFSTVGDVPLNKLIQVFDPATMYEDPSPVVSVLLTAANDVASVDYDDLEDRKWCPPEKVAEAIRLFGLSKLK